MQSSKLMTIIAAAILMAGTLTTHEAKAYEPCQRAINDLREAEAAWYRWMRNNCPPNGGACSNNARGRHLSARVQEARYRVGRYCH